MISHVIHFLLRSMKEEAFSIYDIDLMEPAQVHPNQRVITSVSLSHNHHLLALYRQPPIYLDREIRRLHR